MFYMSQVRWHFHEGSDCYKANKIQTVPSVPGTQNPKKKYYSCHLIITLSGSAAVRVNLTPGLT